jgi:alanine racemase
MDSEHRNGHTLDPVVERPCWLEVDLDAVAANVRAMRSLVGPATAICAVVKADAYGLGAVPVAEAAIAGGAEWLAVARVEEGAHLREAGLAAPILLIAGFAPGEAAEIVRHGLTATIVQPRDAEILASAADQAGRVVAVHVKVDTGLTRYGAATDDTVALLDLLGRLPTLRFAGLYTHFASADEADRSFTREQLTRFAAVRRAIPAHLAEAILVHAANSAGTLAAPEARFGMVRLGITLSGHYPSLDVSRAVALTPAVSLRARALRVYELPAGASIGYNRTFRAERPMRVALVPLGYADGLPRAHSNRASALVRGTRARLVGRVSMDQCVLDVTHAPDVAVGDEVVLFGSSSGERIGLDEFASWSDTIGHEALCRIGPRVPRLYRQNGHARWAGAEPGAMALAASANHLRWRSPS